MNECMTVVLEKRDKDRERRNWQGRRKTEQDRNEGPNQ